MSHASHIILEFKSRVQIVVDPDEPPHLNLCCLQMPLLSILALKSGKGSHPSVSLKRYLAPSIKAKTCSAKVVCIVDMVAIAHVHDYV